MSAFPTGAIPTTNVDAGADSPALARADIKTCFDKVNDIIASKNLASGTAVLDSGGKLPQANVPITPIGSGRVVITTPGSSTWNVPAGVYVIHAQLVGGGGGGGFGTAAHGGGGGGGGVSDIFVSVQPGDVVNYTVGSGGTGATGPTDTSGSDGANSTLTVTRSGTTIASISSQGGIGGRKSGAPDLSHGGEGGISQKTGIPADNANLLGDPLFLQGGVGGTGTTAMGGMGGQSFGGSAPTNTGWQYGGGGGYGSGTGGPSGTNGNAGLLVVTY